MALDGQIPSKKVLTYDYWGLIELVHKVLKPFKSATIVVEVKNYVTVSFIPTLTKSMYTKLRDVISAPVAPGPKTSAKKLTTRLLKDFRLRWLGDQGNSI